MGRHSRFALAGIVLAADIVTKVVAGQTLAGRGTVWLWRPWVGLHLLYNPGAMLGLGAGHPGLVTIVGVVGVVVLAWLLARSGTASVGLALMLGGAAGNLANRLAAGAVTDFIVVRWWPGVFNLADVFLRTGAVIAMAALLVGSRSAAGARR